MGGRGESERLEMGSWSGLTARGLWAGRECMHVGGMWVAADDAWMRGMLCSLAMLHQASVHAWGCA